MIKKIFLNYIVPLLAGCFYAFGFPLKEIPLLFFAPMLGVFVVCYGINLFDLTVRKVDLKKDLLRIFLFSLGGCFLGYNWVPETLRIFGDIVFPFNYMLGSLASFIILPQFFALIFTLYFYSFIKQKRILDFLMKPLSLALLMVLFEEFLPQIFPTHLGHPYLIFAPYLGLAPYGGVPLFSLLSFWAIFEILKFIRTKKINKWIFLPISFFILLNIIMPLRFNPEEGKGLQLRLAQVNIESYLKLASEKGNSDAVREVFGNYVELSLRPSEKPIDLLIWPETAYPYTVESKLWKNTGKALPTLFIQIGQKTRADLVWGGYEVAASTNENDFETTYNALFHFAYTDVGMIFNDVYHKIRLIPFGETLPFGPLNPFLGSVIRNISYFKKGEDFKSFTTRKESRFISVICYEILFSSFVREYLNKVEKPPHFLINLTNDSWYGDTNEPLQHLFLAKWRALEYDLPIVRSTNSGISSILYPDGSESARLPYGVKDILDLELKLKERTPTIYERFGLWITMGVWFILSLIFSVRWKNLRAINREDE